MFCFFHKWKPVGTKYYDLYDCSGVNVGECTVVLYHCEICNKTKTRQIDGNWTLEQCQGKVVLRDDSF